eukprot:PITA_26296
MINDSLEIFMDDFTPYGTTFEDALQNLEKVLKRCIEAHLALSTQKCHMMMNEGIVLGHFVSFLGIQVDPTKIQEFDITIVDRPGKENVVADFLSRLKSNENIPVDDSFRDDYLFAISAHSPWYADIANYLVAGKLSSHLSHREKRKIIQQSARYSWISGCLFHIGLDQEIQRCIGEDQIYDVLKACHDGPCGGHFVDKRTAHKVLRMGYYWSSIFKYAKKYVRACDSYQRMGQPNHRDEMPLNPQVILEPFERWALDFIGPINPPSNQRVYILVCTDYMTKWVEAKALIKANEESVLTFLFEEIFVRFGLPKELVTDGGPPFNSHGFKDTLQKYHIKHRMTTPYHPQSNGQTARLQQLQELDEKRLDAIHQTTMIQQQRTRWHDKTIKQKQFQKGNRALLYDSRFENFQGKLRTRCLGPYEIDVVFPNRIVRLLTIDDNRTPLLVNGYRIHPYQRPISKEDFKATCMTELHYVFLGEFAAPQGT